MNEDEEHDKEKFPWKTTEDELLLLKEKVREDISDELRERGVSDMQTV